MRGFQGNSKTSCMTMASCQVDVCLSGVRKAEGELLQRLSRSVDEAFCAQLTWRGGGAVRRA